MMTLLRFLGVLIVLSVPVFIIWGLISLGPLGWAILIVLLLLFILPV